MTDTLERPTAERTPSDRAALGRAARRSAPRQEHAGWAAPPGRRDPVGVLDEQAATRVPELVPIRYGRMLQSPFAYYRGAAAVMAMDLAGTPRSGFDVQACGDAHASNFGVFATPERGMTFDVNDFDETTRGPWEWDLKRLVASLAIAGRQRGLSSKERRTVLLTTGASYRRTMRDLAKRGNLEVWYAKLDAGAVEQWRSQLAKSQIARTKAVIGKARAKDSTRAVARLTERINGTTRFISDPPLVVPATQLLPAGEAQEARTRIEALLASYARSVRPELRMLLQSYRVVDMARKVVGVGSVGTRAWIVLLAGRDPQDALVLQAKEAEASVLEAYAGASPYSNHGERVVVGQRSMQAASDIFLGWLRAPGTDGVERDFYVRQLWDGKGSVDPAALVPNAMGVYGSMCAWTLARAHARTGDRVAMAAYMGSSDTLDRALAQFAEAYADQNERDHGVMANAVAAGRISAQTGL